LKQLLELDITEKIEIAAPELTTEQIMTPLTDKQTIYQTALSVRPEMKISQLNMDQPGGDMMRGGVRQSSASMESLKLTDYESIVNENPISDNYNEFLSRRSLFADRGE
jgi:hypothetical protein